MGGLQNKAVWAALATAMGVALAFLSLPVGFVNDDYFHLEKILGAGSVWEALDLYALTPDDPAALREAIRVGPMPWWTSTDYRMHFFRPFSSALMWLDYKLFGLWAPGWHVHSVLWYGLLILSFCAVCRPLLPFGTFALAAVLFAVDEGHFIPAGWISNRNALVAVVPALFGLAAHVRWRETGWRWGLPLSVCGYGLGMLGGEIWLGVVGYVVAYEVLGRKDKKDGEDLKDEENRRGTLTASASPGQALTLSRGEWGPEGRWNKYRNRALGILPALVLAVGYVVWYGLAGYGVRNAGGYLDPIGDPAGFLVASPGRFLALLGGQLFSAPIDNWMSASHSRVALTASGAAALVLVAWLLKWMWPRFEENERAALRWMAPGALLSLLPVLSTFPMQRLLVATSVGGAVLIAILARTWWRTRRHEGNLIAAWICLGLGMLHGPIAALQWPMQAESFAAMAHQARERALNLNTGDVPVADARMVVVSDADPVGLMYVPVIRRVHGLDAPRTWHTLTGTTAEVEVTELAENREIKATSGDLIGDGLASVMRGRNDAMAVGDVVELDGLTIKVLAVHDGRPLTIRVEGDLRDDTVIIGETQHGNEADLEVRAVARSWTGYTAAGICSILGGAPRRITLGARPT